MIKLYNEISNDFKTVNNLEEGEQEQGSSYIKAYHPGRSFPVLTVNLLLNHYYKLILWPPIHEIASLPK